MNLLHENIALDVHGKAMGYVWCLECGRKQKVDYVECYAEGWPRCCGYTMILVSKQEKT